jgi:hypothetical protein
MDNIKKKKREGIKVENSNQKMKTSEDERHI